MGAYRESRFTIFEGEQTLVRKARSPPMPHDLSQEFFRVVEEAAIASERTMGKGEGDRADQVAVESMRREMDQVPMNGTIVIGEGERDQAPMLHIGEKVGGTGETKSDLPEVDIAVDSLAPGKNLIFAATGVTDGSLLKGVRFFGDGVRTHSLLLNLAKRQVRFVDSVHLASRPDIKVRF